MMSSSDLPACPACGSREVRRVTDPPQTFFKCAQCGRDRTAAWEAIQPPKPDIDTSGAEFEAGELKLEAVDPKAESFDQEARDRHFEEDQETIEAACMRLGIAATLKVVS